MYKLEISYSPGLLCMKNFNYKLSIIFFLIPMRKRYIYKLRKRDMNFSKVKISIYSWRMLESGILYMYIYTPTLPTQIYTHGMELSESINAWSN